MPNRSSTSIHLLPNTNRLKTHSKVSNASLYNQSPVLTPAIWRLTSLQLNSHWPGLLIWLHPINSQGKIPPQGTIPISTKTNSSSILLCRSNHHSSHCKGSCLLKLQSLCSCQLSSSNHSKPWHLCRLLTYTRLKVRSIVCCKESEIINESMLIRYLSRLIFTVKEGQKLYLALCKVWHRVISLFRSVKSKSITWDLTWSPKYYLLISYINNYQTVIYNSYLIIFL